MAGRVTRRQRDLLAYVCFAGGIASNDDLEARFGKSTVLACSANGWIVSRQTRFFGKGPRRLGWIATDTGRELNSQE